jgi:hypothetical protein
LTKIPAPAVVGVLVEAAAEVRVVVVVDVVATKLTHEKNLLKQFLGIVPLK